MRRSMLAILASATILAPALAGSTLAAGGSGAATGCAGLLEIVAGLPLEDVSGVEQGDLVYMREEEKLARDVYRALDDLWGLRALANIAWAEQTHMDALLALLDKYGITDPVGTHAAGVFSDAELQGLFGELLDRGSASLVDALVVGATIEDRDIADLTAALDRADNADIRTVYQNLRKASRNHLRSFVGLLAAGGTVYEPQYLDGTDYEAIIGSPSEHGLVDADGQSRTCEIGRRPGPGRGRPALSSDPGDPSRIRLQLRYLEPR